MSKGGIEELLFGRTHPTVQETPEKPRGAASWTGISSIYHCAAMQGLVEAFFGQATLSDHRADGTDGDVLAGMWNDDGMTVVVTILGMAATY